MTSAVESAVRKVCTFRRPRWLVGMLVSFAVLAISAVCLEAGLRFALFSPSMRKTALAQHLRQRQLYAPKDSRENWKLNTLLEGAGTKRGHSCFDWRFGWTKPAFDPVTLAHEDEPRLAGRRPVLLFGDSFASCMKRTQVCWQDLLETSELAERYCLLNYGVGGYGVDQAYLLMDAVIERFRNRDPVVAFGILVDDDLARSYLPIRRVPKPYFLVENGQLVLHPVRHATPHDFLEDNPVTIRSYAWRYLLFGSTLLPRSVALALTSEHGMVVEMQSINRALIAAAWSELTQAKLEGFFLLLHGRRAMEGAGPYGWEEPFLHATLTEFGIQYVSTRPYLREYLARNGATAKTLFHEDAHYTDHGNAVAFPALLDGLRGIFVSGSGSEKR